MTTVTHSLPTHAQSPSATQLPSLLDRLTAWFQARRERANIIRGLQALDDRDLRDLHIHRTDFDAIADGTYRR